MFCSGTNAWRCLEVGLREESEAEGRWMSRPDLLPRQIFLLERRGAAAHWLSGFLLTFREPFENVPQSFSGGYKLSSKITLREILEFYLIWDFITDIANNML